MSETEFPEIPGYTVISRLGQGGMATIYLAEQHSFERKVALKVMALHLLSDPSFGDRFLREARIVAQLTHRHFVPVYDVGQHGDFHYMSMEYLPGGDLKGLLAKGLPLADGIRIVEEVADGLNYAARKNFIHRDIKPENILFREDGSAVVCDFGIARQVGSSTQMTIVGAVIGTPHYMSPEQAKGGVLDSRSDLYSLGVILFEMLTGEVPYKSDSAISTGIMHITEPIPLLPEELAVFQPLIDTVLAKLPNDRFQTGHELMLALRELEETAYAVIHATSVTVILSKEEMQSGLKRHRASLQGSSLLRSLDRPPAGRRSTASFQSGGVPTNPTPVPQPTAPAPLLGPKGKVIALSLVTVMGITVLGWWYFLPSNTVPDRSVARESAPTFDKKVRQLNQLALDAIEAGRLYSPENDNAQHYLTSLLVLSPGDREAMNNIEKLFGIYLGRAQVALEGDDLSEANEMLNQASQIRFYVRDEAMLERQISLRRNQIDTQQQNLIATERDEEIDRLLAEARERVKRDNLTTPPGDNAYDRYHRVLSLEPANAFAAAGIENIAGSFLGKAKKQAKLGEIGRARAYISAAIQIFPRHPEMASVRDLVDAEEKKQRQGIIREQQQKTAALELEKRKREEQRKLKNMEMQKLLANASDDVKARNLESAIEKYSKALNIDPVNVDALNGLEDVAIRYIEIAREAISFSDLEEAEKNLKHARTLSPTNSQFREVQTELIAARDEALRQAAAVAIRNERISALLKGSELAMEKGNLYLPRGINAVENLQQALQLDATNQKSLELRDKLNAEIYHTGLAFVGANDFADAQLAIDVLVKNQADVSRVGSLQGTLNEKEKQVVAQALAAKQEREKAEKLALEQAEQKRLAKAEADRLAREKAEKLALERAEQERLAKAEADTLARERAQRENLARKNAEAERLAREERATRENAELTPRPREPSRAEKLLAMARSSGGSGAINSRNYQKLGGIYSEVLRLEPGNGAAVNGLAKVSNFSANAARRAIAERNFKTAEVHIDQITRVAPGYSALTGLREELAYTRRQQEQALEILTAADALTATLYKKPSFWGNNDKARKTLRMAYSKINSARGVDQHSPALPHSEQKLIDKYTNIISDHLADKDLDEAREFMDDLSATKLSSSVVESLGDKISKLEQESDKTDQGVAVGVF